MFFSDWFYRILAYLGLPQKETRTFLLVLDDYQRDILRLLLSNEWWHRLVQHRPTPYTAHPTSGEFSIKDIKFKLFHLGDHQMVHRALRDYHVKVDAVAFVEDIREVDTTAPVMVINDDCWLASGVQTFAVSGERLDALLSNAGYASRSFLTVEVFAESKEQPIVALLLLLNFLLSVGPALRREARDWRYSARRDTVARRREILQGDIPGEILKGDIPVEILEI